MSLAGGPVALSVTQVAGPDAPRLSVAARGQTDRQRAEVLARSALNRLVGLTVDLSPFAAMAAPDPLLGPLAARMRGLRPPRFPTVFEALVNGVACQQLSLAVGIQLLNRLAADRGQGDCPTVQTARAHSPTLMTSHRLEPEDLKRHGFSSTKARTIIETAQAVVADDLDLEALAQVEDGAAIERLTSLRGIGRWTAEYVLLRGLGRLHIFPGDDVGAHNKLRHLFGIDMPLDYRGGPAAGRALASVRRRRLLPPAPRLALPGRPRGSGVTPIRFAQPGPVDHRAPRRAIRAGALAEAIVEVRSPGEAGWW